MNKSELIILKQLKEIDELTEENMKLKDKVEGLQDRKDTLEIRIDKAVKYIENAIDRETNCFKISQIEESKKLYEILKGDNK